MRIVGVVGELHVELPDGGTMLYCDFMYLRAVHRHCCRSCAIRREMERAWRLPVTADGERWK